MKNRKNTHPQKKNGNLHQIGATISLLKHREKKRGGGMKKIFLGITIYFLLTSPVILGLFLIIIDLSGQGWFFVNYEPAKEFCVNKGYEDYSDMKRIGYTINIECEKGEEEKIFTDCKISEKCVSWDKWGDCEKLKEWVTCYG